MIDRVDLTSVSAAQKKEYCDKLFALYDTLINPLREMENISAKAGLNMNKIARLKAEKTDIGTVWKFIGVGLVVYFILNALFKKSKILWFIFGPDPMNILLFLMCVAMPVILWELYKRKERKKQIEILSENVQKLDELLNEKYDEREEQYAFVPAEYFSSEALSFFVKMYADGRVKDLNQAMNMYDQYKHRKNLEMGQQQLIYQQNQTMQMMNEMAQTQRQMQAELSFDTAMIMLTTFGGLK